MGCGVLKLKARFFWGLRGREEKMRGDFALQHEDSEVTLKYNHS